MLLATRVVLNTKPELVKNIKNAFRRVQFIAVLRQCRISLVFAKCIGRIPSLLYKQSNNNLDMTLSVSMFTVYKNCHFAVYEHAM